MALVWLGLAGSAYWWGRNGSVPQAKADPPTFPQTDSTPLPAAPAQPPSDYSRRVVAYIHNTIPITREDLGEYLIARMGHDRLESLLGGDVSSDTRNILESGANPLAEEQPREPMSSDRSMPRRPGAVFGEIRPLTGLDQIIGLALGSPEFQRR